MNRLTLAAARLREALGGPGLMIGLFSLLSLLFGLIVVGREYDRPRQMGRATLHQVLSGWARVPNYLGLTLIDDVDRLRQAPPDARARRRERVVAALNDLGAELHRQDELFPLIQVIALDLAPTTGPAIARWDAPGGPPFARSDLIDHVPLVPANGGPAFELIVRYRINPDLVGSARGLETSYHRLLLALVGLSGFSLICLGYMVLHARALSERAARESAREATLDLADRTCHELGNGVFVLSNERRNLSGHLDLVERFLDEDAEARAAAARRVGMAPDLAARWEHALAREYAARGIAPDLELRGSAALARQVCRQIGVCSEYIARTVHELDGFLKHSSQPVALAPVAVAECCDEALMLLGPQLDAHDARVDRQGAAGPIVALGDRRLLVHVLVNLLKNAIEAASSVGRAPRIRLTATREGMTVRITVADDGPGIPEPDRCRLFRSGYTTKGTGRGRGLAIVRESVLIQGGAIDVVSPSGGGTEFRIRLPAAKHEWPETKTFQTTAPAETE